MGGPTPSGNIVGGTAPGEGNILIGLKIDGPADNNIVIGNPLLVGVRVQGATQYGVFARNNRIGGPTAAERNVISGNGRYGEEGFPDGSQISIVDADDTLVEGNYIGTTADGMARYPQQIGPEGVEVRDARGTTIRGNLIAGLRTVGINHYAGQVFGVAVSVNATNANIQDTVIEGNTIGLAADGVTPIVTHSGVVVSPFLASRHAFGTLVASNHIARVEKDGVFVGSLESGVTITGNSIHDNGELGIDLNNGGNNQQSFPVLQSATTTGSSFTVQGTLDSVPASQFRVEFFASPSCDPSGFGEGATFLGSTLVTTDGRGHATFSITLPGLRAGRLASHRDSYAFVDGRYLPVFRLPYRDHGWAGLRQLRPRRRPLPRRRLRRLAPLQLQLLLQLPTPTATPTPATATATAAATVTPTATATPTPTATAIGTPPASPTPTPVATPIASPTPVATPAVTPTPTTTPAVIPLQGHQPLDPDAVQTGDNVGIGGFIITGDGSQACAHSRRSDLR